nr:unnamed protein product [Callosobruchus chinensis]
MKRKQLKLLEIAEILLYLMPIRKKSAARQYNIPHSTLLRKLSYSTFTCRKMRPTTELYQSEEKILEDYQH